MPLPYCGGGTILNGVDKKSVGRRLTLAAQAAGIEGRLTGHSGRVGLASELTARGASTTETMLAGGWQTARMVAHYSAGVAAEQGAVAKYPCSCRAGRRPVSATPFMRAAGPLPNHRAGSGPAIRPGPRPGGHQRAECAAGVSHHHPPPPPAVTGRYGSPSGRRAYPPPP